MLGFLRVASVDWAFKPNLPNRRGGWEFQAVVAGRCAPIDRIDQAPPLRGRRLWVFPPGDLHGWVGEPGKPCRIAVAHFDGVLEPLQQHGRIEVALSAAEARRVEKLILQLIPDYRRPTTLTPLRVQRVLIELTLLALSGTTERPHDFASTKVNQAMAWFTEHMDSGPSVPEIARAVHVSPSHLRRLFAEAGADAPLTEMRRLQHQRAEHLLRHTDLPLHQAAEACGFHSASDFSRVFRKATGHPPSKWRDAQAGRAVT